MKPEVTELLDKAEENIHAADILIKAQFFEIAVSRGYYAIFYVALALLIEEGKTVSSHREVQSTFGFLFAKGNLPITSTMPMSVKRKPLKSLIMRKNSFLLLKCIFLHPHHPPRQINLVYQTNCHPPAIRQFA